jgi:apolipoprotein N-acyltransferase
VHDKIHLWLDEHGTSVGRRAKSFETDVGRVGVEICFDSCFTDVTRRIARSGAEIVAMPNLDPSLGDGVLHRLHGTVLPFRAVENHVPMIRADWTGLSQIVDTQGRILRQAPMNRADVVVADVRLGDGSGTVFTFAADWFAYLCLAVVAFASVTRLKMPAPV